jgi:uncharacterized surface protein with fasciclin (FAS1) repeats
MRSKVIGFESRAATVLGVVVAMAVLVAVTLSSTFSRASNQDIVDTAVTAGQFNTLAAALKASGLVDTLKGSGPFTVFAPTDAAFAKLPAGTLENLLKPENKAKLVAILTYHVLPGDVTAAQVATLTQAKTVNGAILKLSAHDGKLMVNNADVVKADVEASNGVIHVIDAVLLPPAD